MVGAGLESGCWMVGEMVVQGLNCPKVGRLALSVGFAPAGRARGGDRGNLSRLGSGLLPQRGKSAALTVAMVKSCVCRVMRMAGGNLV